MRSGCSVYTGMILVLTRYLLSMSFDSDTRSFEHGLEALTKIKANTSFKPVVSEINALSCEWFKVERKKLLRRFCPFNYDVSDDAKNNDGVTDEEEDIHAEVMHDNEKPKPERKDKQLRWFCQSLFPNKDSYVDCDQLQNIFKDYYSSYCRNQLNPIDNSTHHPDLCNRVKDFFEGYEDVVREPANEVGEVKCEQYDTEISVFGNKYCESIGEGADWLGSFCESLDSRNEENCEDLKARFQDFNADICEQVSADNMSSMCTDIADILRTMWD